MRRRLAMIGLLAMTPLAALVGWWLMPEPRVTSANSARILGMTLEEVEELLGESEHGWDGFGDFDANGYKGIRIWKSGGCLLAADFKAGRVERTAFRETGLWERIDDWYHGRERDRTLMFTVMVLCS